MFTSKLLSAVPRLTHAAILVGAISTASLEAKGQEGQVWSFDIPIQPLAQTIVDLAKTTQVNIIAPDDLVSGLNAPSINGELTVEGALALAIQGTNLSLRVTETGALVLERFSQDGSGPLRLEQITVLGSRQVGGATLSNIPTSITSIGADDIQSALPTAGRIEDLIARQAPGFNPTPNGIRNIRGRTAQVFINGVPVNEQLRASGASDITLIDPTQIDNIEVSRGANSAYGFGSPGGIIGLSTPQAETDELLLRSRLSASFNPHRPGGSYQTNVYQSASQILDKFDYHVGGNLAFDGNEFTADGKRAYNQRSPMGTENDQLFLGSADVSLGYKIAKDKEIRFAGTFGYTEILKGFTTDEGGTYRVEDSVMDRSPEIDGGFRISRTLNLSYTQDDLWGSAIKLEAFNSDTYTERYSINSNREQRDETTNQYYGLRTSVTTPLDGAYEGLTANWGVDVMRNRFFRPQIYTDTGEVRRYLSPDVTLDTLAPYLQLNAPVGRFELTGGFRHERYTGHTEGNVGSGGITAGDIDPFNLTLFNAGAVYALSENIDLFGTYTQGAEVTQLGRAARSATTVEEVDAQPAKSDQYEIGSRADWGNASGTLAAFYTESDLLNSLSCDGSNPCEPQREPRKIWGVEGTADWRVDAKWSLGGGFAWQGGLREPEGESTTRIGSTENPPILMNAYIGYAPTAKWRNTLFADYRHSRDVFGDSTDFGEGKVDSLFLLHFASEYDLEQGTLRLGIRNLLNRKYYSISSESGNSEFGWIPEEGTRISLSYATEW